MSVFLIQPITTAEFVLVDEQGRDLNLASADVAAANVATTTDSTDGVSTPSAAELIDLCILVPELHGERCSAGFEDLVYVANKDRVTYIMPLLAP